MFSITRKAIPSLVVSLKASNGSKALGVIQTRNSWVEGFQRCFPKGDPMLTVGDYPKTQEERERAAKKYNLIPEDYEPYDEDEGFGDYPKLKAIGGFNRDPYDDFDDVMDNRFHGEPFHRDADLYYWERVDPLAHEKMRLSHWVSFPIFMGVALFVPFLYWFTTTFKIDINNPVKHRPTKANPLLKDYVVYEFPPSPNDIVHH